MTTRINNIYKPQFASKCFIKWANAGSRRNTAQFYKLSLLVGLMLYSLIELLPAFAIYMYLPCSVMTARQAPFELVSAGLSITLTPKHS